MRRLVLLCLVAAATSAYNLIVQEVTLTGGLITSDKITCDNIFSLHIAGKSYNFDCYQMMSPDDKTKIEARKLVYTSAPITTKTKTLNCDIADKDGTSTVSFKFTPQMKTGQTLTATDEGSYKSTAVTIATTAAPAASTDASTGKPADAPPACDPANDPKCTQSAVVKPNLLVKPVNCAALVNKGHEACATYCDDARNADQPACALIPSIVRTKAARKLVTRPLPDESAVSMELTRPVAIRGPGPVRPPVHHEPAEDTVVVTEDEEERLRVKRDDSSPPAVDDTTIHVAVSYSVLDEAGNPAAVWAAVIEGIILLLLIGACFYFFFWAPRARQVASAAADPYKEDGPSYSVSYANNSFGNNQRIDAFGTPTPAAPPRPANSAYMDDYITDNIGAMSRPGATTTTQPASAATNSSAFQPTHQRFDSSGLVTVNLS